MQFKIEEADIFIYGRMEPAQTNQILLGKVALFKRNKEFSAKLTNLEKDEGKLWLIRESRVEGLLTVQSVSYEKNLSNWKINTPQRYMLSNQQGWIGNNEGPNSELFNVIVASVGGIFKVTEENTAPHLPGLLSILSTNGYTAENRINPKVGEETKTKGYSTYTIFSNKPQDAQPRKATTIFLPEGILMALSCPLVTKKTGEAKLMKEPVTLVKDGITYERADLLEQYPDLQSAKDYYPNIKLRTIINYIASNALEPSEYFAKLQKIEEDIQDPILLQPMKNPVLSPSGHSYEESSLNRWINSQLNDSLFGTTIQPISDPITKENIRGKALIVNINLKSFIKAWPTFYEEQKHNCQASIQPQHSS